MQAHSTLSRLWPSRSAWCRVAAADWVITTPGKFVKDFDLYTAITWRRVIADEVHTLTATIPGMAGRSRLDKDTALMKRVAQVPVSVARWCLSGTPLKNYKQVQSMDRVFHFLHTGVKTQQLTSMQFVHVMSAVAIRFSKDGTFQVRMTLCARQLRSTCRWRWNSGICIQRCLAHLECSSLLWR